MPKLITKSLFTTLSAAALVGVLGVSAEAAEVITLTQTGCQFLEPEGTDHSFKTQKSADCEKINAKSGSDRLSKSKTITLKPGDYVFRVKNKNVPYELGFWFRSKDYNWKNPLHKLSKVSVSGGGLTTGKTQDYKVSLKPGEYVFSCPLNPTPNYRVVVPEG
jgi:hypothetical protein